MRFNIFVFACIVLLAVSCKSDKNAGSSDVKDGVAKEYYPDGMIKSETDSKDGKANGLMKNYDTKGILTTVYTFKDGIRQGPAVEYYTDGKLKLKMFYKDGKRDGVTLWYYKSGKLFRETPYKAGKVEGIKKSYYEDGKLMAEAPYLNDYPGTGLKEYNSKGVLIKDDTRIVIRETNRGASRETITLELSLSESHPGINFYHGEMTNGEYLSGTLWQLPVKDGKSRYSTPIPSKGYKMDPITFIASYETSNSNYRVIAKKYSYSADKN